MTALELLKKKLLERISEESGQLSDGVAEDYPQYCKHVGQVYGLRWAVAEVEELIKRVEEE